MIPKKPLLFSGVLATGLTLTAGSIECGELLGARARYQEVMQKYEVAKEEAFEKVVDQPYGSKERIKSITDWHTCLYQDFPLYEKNSLRERLDMLKGSVALKLGPRIVVIPYNLPGPVSRAEYENLTDSTRQKIMCWEQMR